MLVTLQWILKKAEEQKTAIGSFNTPNLESLQAVIRAAEELKLPVIIQFAQVHESWIPLSVIGPIMVEAARKASVPVCVHLDHGESLEYVQKALDLGFTGVMYDGSTLSYEENVANTKKAVEMASMKGVGVEAELGSMGRSESGKGNKSGEEDETKIYTDPLQAREFVNATGVSALACSFGTTHGIYLTRPRLDFSVVRNVRSMTQCLPVVMHDQLLHIHGQERRHRERGIPQGAAGERAPLLLLDPGRRPGGHEGECQGCHAHLRVIEMI